MKKILILLCVLSKTIFAIEYTGTVKEIVSPIKINFSDFDGVVEGKIKQTGQVNGIQDNQFSNIKLKTKKTGNNVEIDFYLSNIKGSLVFILSPKGKVKNYSFVYKENSNWETYSKSDIRKLGLAPIFDAVLGGNFYDYEKTFSKGDLLPHGDIKDIIKVIFENINLQITYDFNILDTIPENSFPKLVGETCSDGRSSYLFKYDIFKKLNTSNPKSVYEIKGYKLIDKETGYLLKDRTKSFWKIDFGKNVFLGESFGKRNQFIIEEETITDMNFAKTLGNNCKDLIIIKNETTSENTNNIKQKLKGLKELFEEELITQEEYDAKRKEILDEM